MENNNMDNLFEELLRESASLAVKELGEEIEPHPEIEFSKEHQEKMNKLFVRERRKIRARKIGVHASKIAAVLVLVAVVSGVAVFNVDALRIRFLNMFTDTQPTNTEISFREGNSYSVGNVTIGFVPEGFEVENEKSTESMSYLKFRYDEDYFEIDIRNSYNNISIDTENAEAEKIEVNGLEILYSKKEDSTFLSCHMNEKVINISGNIDDGLMIEIIKDIRFN